MTAPKIRPHDMQKLVAAAAFGLAAGATAAAVSATDKTHDRYVHDGSMGRMAQLCAGGGSSGCGVRDGSRGFHGEGYNPPIQRSSSSYSNGAQPANNEHSDAALLVGLGVVALLGVLGRYKATPPE